MSSEEQVDRPEKPEEDVVAHRYLIDEPEEGDPSKKRRRRVADDLGDDEFDKKKK
jgi:hypothetical protein